MTPTFRAYLVDAFVFNLGVLFALALWVLGYVSQSEELLMERIYSMNAGMAMGWCLACHYFRKKKDEPAAPATGYRGYD